MPTRTLPAWQFDADAAARALAKHFGTRDLAAFGVEDRDLRSAPPARCFEYAAATQQAALAHVRTLAVEIAGEYLLLDAATRRNLEITETLRGEPAPTLLSLLDTCATAAGSRLLRHWLTHPLRVAGRGAGAARRHRRLAANACRRARAIRARARPTVDVERIAARIALAVGAAARPRRTARHARAPAGDPGAVARPTQPTRRRCSPRSPPISTSMPQWAALLTRAIAPEPAAQVRDGGVIAAGFDAELDELRAIDDHCGEFLVDLEARERERTGIANLKVEYNRVHGFYIEVTHAHATQGARRLPAPADAEERRALHHAGAQGLRGQGAVGAGARARAREAALRRLLAELAPAIPALQQAAAALAALDVLATFAERAEALDLARPTFVAAPGSRSAAGAIRSSSGRSTRSFRTTSISRPSAGC